MTADPGALGYAVVVALLARIGHRLREVSRDPKTPRGDAVLLYLALGSDAVAIAALALDASMRILF